MAPAYLPRLVGTFIEREYSITLVEMSMLLRDDWEDEAAGVGRCKARHYPSLMLVFFFNDNNLKKKNRISP
jgi:hypothetical protein